jgi:copper chaperone
MKTMTLRVEGMSCAHCVRAVTGAIRARDPGAFVEVDLDAGQVRTNTALAREIVAAALEKEGYRVLQ